MRFAFNNSIMFQVTGWGRTQPDGNLSDVLKELRLPFINYHDCKENLPRDFLKYLSNDKMCAGYLNKGL